MKFFNVFASTLIAASLLAATPAWAGPKESASSANRQAPEFSVRKIPNEMKEALEKTYNILKDIKALKIIGAEIYEETESYPSLWSFELQGEKSEEGRVYAHVTIHADTGEILEYSIYNPKWKSQKTISERRARKASDQFLKKVLGAKAKQLKLSKISDPYEEDEDGSGPTHRKVYYERLVNGVPVDGLFVRVVVNGDGRIVEYQNMLPYELDTSTFPDPKQAMNADEAQKAYRDLLDMQLLYNQYQIISDDNDEDEWQTRPVLKYVPSYKGSMDAITGEKITDDETENELESPERIDVSPKGTKWVIKSREEAEKLLESTLDIDLQKAEFRESASKDRIVYRWIEENDQGELYLSLSLDKQTGQASDLIYDYEEYEEEDDWEDFDTRKAREKALEILETFLPEQTEQVQLVGLRETYYGYSLQFFGVYQDVPVENQLYNIMIGPEGHVLGLRLSFQSDVESLPDNEGTISAEQAADIYLKVNPLQLKYVLDETYDEETDEFIVAEPSLQYVPSTDKQGFIDAFTGEYYIESEE